MESAGTTGLGRGPVWFGVNGHMGKRFWLCRPTHTMYKPVAIFALALVVLVPRAALAHQPRIVGSGPVDIRQPEVSQAFYGELTGAPVEYRIQSAEAFRLYVGILVPDIPAARKDISAEIYRVTPNGNETVTVLDGQAFDWTPFFEEFAQDNYFRGPEYKANDSQKGVELKGCTVPGGTYVIKVFSPTNQGKYTLATGDLKEFPLKEITNAAMAVPQIKARFFGESPLRICLSPFGWGYVLILYLFAFLVGFSYRTLLRKLAKTGAAHPAEEYRRHGLAHPGGPRVGTAYWGHYYFLESASALSLRFLLLRSHLQLVRLLCRDWKKQLSLEPNQGILAVHTQLF